MLKVKQEMEDLYGGPLSDELLMTDESPRERVKRGFTVQSPLTVHSSTSISGPTTTNASGQTSSALRRVDEGAISQSLSSPSPFLTPIEGRSRASSMDSGAGTHMTISTVGEEEASLALRLSDIGTYCAFLCHLLQLLN
jgi:hypothetical protein